MALIEWSDQLSVNVAEIDGQHKKLVDMINRLHEAMRTGQGRAVIKDILTGLADYVVLHFTAEEKYMAKFGYADLTVHKAEHTRFVDTISKFHGDFEGGKVSLTIEVMNFLRDWLTKHIQGTDRKYTECFHENGLK